MNVRKMRVFAAGTFDGLHPGHVAFLEEAAKFGELHVVVARDESVKKTKGRKPLFNEQERLLLVSSLKCVKKAFVGSKNWLESVEKVKPQIIVLGHDQKSAWLFEELRKSSIKAIVVRARKYKRSKYRSSLMKKKKEFGKEI